MNGSALLHAAAASLPAALLALGGTAGGLWCWAAAGYMALLVPALDAVLPGKLGAAPMPRAAARRLSLLLAGMHFALLYLGVAAIAGASGLDWPARAAEFVGLGLWLGQVSNANAHELIHSPHRFDRALGAAVYASLLFGHHASAHRLVHHVWVGTEDDPNTPRAGESCYRFLPRAWIGSFRAGLGAENARRRRARRGLHPYALYLGGSALALAGSLLLAGWAGVAVHVLLAAHATVQLLTSDYVQHYGLQRQRQPDGKPQPVSPAHAWNACQPVSTWMMLNATRHSDHHVHPARAFAELELDRDMPLLPHSLPVMGFLALFPNRFRQVMEPHLKKWRAANAREMA